MDTERTLYLDPDGAVRSYHTGGGSDDSAIQGTYYYDRHGRLRFVFATAGAVNGTVIEYRIYLSKSGARLWEERRDSEGAGLHNFRSGFRTTGSSRTRCKRSMPSIPAPRRSR
jgi:hypothetical protein